ncbi:hypothetical protein GFS24_11515 [Chitinophaga sp. SYP-B3965]|uniref:hypothetical protein n=1 Tax=Chitinophaga sp. SYP-B3965 TaxID=2663120 RepID=UPI0012995D09|nr:hypothetical protein [Chitinophaga sp. SYP-B3965]MRG45748.1 hypothetical protein [Chitinophaga sp. SYP-B3965]
MVDKDKKDKEELHDVSEERMLPEVRESDLPDTGRSNVKDAGLDDVEETDDLKTK